jgi:cytochrome P450
VNFNIAGSHKVLVEPWLGHNIQTMDGEEHRQHRGVVNELFMPRAVRGYVEKLIEPIAHELLDRIEGEREVDFVPAFGRPFPFLVITRLLNIPVADEHLMMNWAEKLLEFVWDPVGSRAARDAFDAYMIDIIRERRRAPRDDFISAIVTAEVEGKRLDDEEVATFCRLLFPAGSDTTYKNIGGLFYYALQDETVRERAKRSDADRNAIVSESLRLHPPVPMQVRLATGETAIADALIQPGETVLFSILSANRDTVIFPDPERFDPSRDNRQIITFGRGAHFCLGMHLARRELEAALKVILERFPKVRLTPGKPVEFAGAVLRGPRALWIQPYGEP